MSRHCFHLLHIDDEESDAFFFTRALKQCSKEVVAHWAQSGQLAVAYLGNDSNPPPNLIVCDVSMPAMSGFEFLKWLRASRFHRIPVVMLSGSELGADVNRAFDLGANAYVGKPTSSDELLKTMNRIIEFWCEACVLPSITYETAFLEPVRVGSA